MKLQKLNRALAGALLVSGALGVASQAHALNITPAGPGLVATVSGLPASALNANDLETLLSLNFDLASVYKQDEPVGSMPPYNESGNGAAYYSTTFNGDLSGGTISWNGPLWIACPDCYLVVKDGNQDPYAYIFNLGGWDGKEAISLSGFWPQQGSISYVEVFNNPYPGGGGGGSLVPEPETYAMLLAGLGLVGFAARRKLSKTA